MAILDKQIMALFSWEIFQQIASGQSVNMYKFNLFTAMLISQNIPFEVSFDSGSRKDAPAIQLTIHINPVSTMVFVISLAPGSNAFEPSP